MLVKKTNKLFLVGLLLVFLFSGFFSVRADSITEDRNDEEITIGIALSGGAAWGLAHIGVLEVLEENDIKLDYIAGTSSGAAVGSLYASGVTPQEMAEIANDIKWLDLIRPIISDLSIFDSRRIRTFMQDKLETENFSDLKIGFTAVATDLGRGEVVYLDSGNLSFAVMASATIPIIFEPVKYGDKMLVDGGLSNNLPLDVLEKKEMDVIIGVDVNSSFSIEAFPRNLIEVGIRSYNIMQRYHIAPEKADILIRPDLEGIRGMDFDSHEEIIAEGRRAAEEALPQIKERFK